MTLSDYAKDFFLGMQTYLTIIITIFVGIGVVKRYIFSNTLNLTVLLKTKERTYSVSTANKVLNLCSVRVANMPPQ